MKFSTRKDIEAPLDFVFDRAADFAAIERQILRRGVELRRVRAGAPSGLGIAWKAEPKIRGRRRDVDATITALDGPNGYTVEGATDGMNFVGTVETIALSRSRTRLFATFDVRPTTLTARIILQSAKLAKGTLNARFDTRIHALAQDIEDRYAARK